MCYRVMPESGCLLRLNRSTEMKKQVGRVRSRPRSHGGALSIRFGVQSIVKTFKTHSGGPTDGTRFARRCFSGGGDFWVCRFCFLDSSSGKSLLMIRAR